MAQMITQENVNSILSTGGFRGEIDLLSIDIDGMDYWIWKAIDVVEPHAVVIEYQSILGPERSWTVPYKPDFNYSAYEVNRGSYPTTRAPRCAPWPSLAVRRATALWAAIEETGMLSLSGWALARRTCPRSR
jgi:hypothetical protein